MRDRMSHGEASIPDCPRALPAFLLSALIHICAEHSHHVPDTLLVRACNVFIRHYHAVFHPRALASTAMEAAVSHWCKLVHVASKLSTMSVDFAASDLTEITEVASDHCDCASKAADCCAHDRARTLMAPLRGLMDAVCVACSGTIQNAMTAIVGQFQPTLYMFHLTNDSSDERVQVAMFMQRCLRFLKTTCSQIVERALVLQQLVETRKARTAQRRNYANLQQLLPEMYATVSSVVC